MYFEASVEINGGGDEESKEEITREKWENMVEDEGRREWKGRKSSWMQQ